MMRNADADNSNCPETIDLYAYIDGELDRAAFAAIDEHVLRCSCCRDEVRALTRFQRALLLEPTTRDSGPESGDAFFAKLLGRLATREESTTAVSKAIASPRSGRSPALLAAAAVLLLTLGGLLGFVVERSRRLAASKDAATELVVARVEDGVDVKRWRGAFSSGEAASWNETTWREFRREAVRAGSGAKEWLVREARSPDRKCRAVAIAVVERFRPEGGQAVLASALEGRRDSVLAESALRASVALGGPQAWDVLKLAARTGATARPVLRAALELKDLASFSWDFVAAVAADRMGSEGADVLAVLEREADPKAGLILLELELSGVQSRRLADVVGGRLGLTTDVRRIAFSDREPRQRRSRALRILGRMGDSGSTAKLATMLGDPVHGADAAQALAAVGDAESMGALARRLALGRSGRSAGRDDLQDELTRAIAGLGVRGARFYIERARSDRSTWRSNYILAAGLCGDHETVADLGRLVGDDAVKPHVVDAIASIGDRSAVEALTAFAGSRDQRLRAYAAEALKRRAQPSARGARSALFEVSDSLDVVAATDDSPPSDRTGPRHDHGVGGD